MNILENVDCDMQKQTMPQALNFPIRAPISMRELNKCNLPCNVPLAETDQYKLSLLSSGGTGELG